MSPSLHEVALAVALGTMLGVTHGIEPDHLVEISAQVLRKGGDSLQAFLLGAVFGAGHVLTTVLIGLAGLGLGWLMPDGLGELLDRLSGPLLVLVGLWALAVALRRARRPDAAVEMAQPANWRHRLAALKDQILLGSLFALNPAPEAIAIFLVMLPGGHSGRTWGLGGWQLGLVTLLAFGLGITLVMGLFGILVQRSLQAAGRLGMTLSRWLPVGAGIVILLVGLTLTLPGVASAVGL